ncbi:MAG: isoprenylcysteine carboxylmethyltransferase family protein [Deltaproteobacteria bacterium]|nr:isoprenylcysteine carboxylmethyltransferase family protein [Deltaproteobacteria bacterium]
MKLLQNGPLKFLRRTPVRTFILYPVITLAWELFLGGGSLRLQPVFLFLMLWGYLQYRLCGNYRISRAGGGPGIDTPPERLLTSGLYSFTRNPMYLGHIVFLIGLTLTMNSLLAGLITVASMVWFHYRVLQDEHRLIGLFGQPYLDYMAAVKRWVPGIF